MILTEYLAARAGEFDRIAPERKAVLTRAAMFVREKTRARQPAQLLFICTHNSRRSHLAQIWATLAAERYHVSNVACFSGGTEATAFNPRAVAALRRAGVRVEQASSEPPQSGNPEYLAHLATEAKPLRCFSKVYNDPANPRSDYCAIMTCAEADKNCPAIPAAALRLSLPYRDPKASDGQPDEAAAYDSACAEISREMFYLFSQCNC